MIHKRSTNVGPAGKHMDEPFGEARGLDNRSEEEPPGDRSAGVGLQDHTIPRSERGSQGASGEYPGKIEWGDDPDDADGDPPRKGQSWLA